MINTECTFRLRLSIIGLCLAGVLLIGGAAQAGGLYLQSEFGTPSMGTAGAGAEAAAGSAGTAFHNPAGMTRLERPDLLLGAGFLVGNTKFDADNTTPISGGNGGNAAGFAPILGTFYAHPLTDKLRFGVSLTSISGAVLDYDDDWAGRFLNQEVSVLTLSLFPSLAYKVNDWLSIGAGPVLTYGVLEFDVAVPPPSGTGKVKIEDADDFQVAFKGGVLITLSQNTRIGITYQSETEMEFDGDVKINPIGAQAGVSTKIPFPQFVRASIFHRVNPYFALVASVNWEEWSVFDNQVVSVSQGSANIKRNLQDTYGIRGGVIIKPHEKWLLSLGIGYDSSAVETSRDRTPDLPLDRQIRYSTGVAYKWSEKIEVGANFQFMDAGKAPINNSLLSGEYENNDLYFFTMNIRWIF